MLRELGFVQIFIIGIFDPLKYITVNVLGQSKSLTDEPF